MTILKRLIAALFADRGGAREGKEYQIRKTPLGYLPLYHDGVGWLILDKDGSKTVYFGSAAAFPGLHLDTESQAGACINAHSAMADAEVIWTGGEK